MFCFRRLSLSAFYLFDNILIIEKGVFSFISFKVVHPTSRFPQICGLYRLSGGGICACGWSVWVYWFSASWTVRVFLWTPIIKNDSLASGWYFLHVCFAVTSANVSYIARKFRLATKTNDCGIKEVILGSRWAKSFFYFELNFCIVAAFSERNATIGLLKILLRERRMVLPCGWSLFTCSAIKRFIRKLSKPYKCITACIIVRWTLVL